MGGLYGGNPAINMSAQASAMGDASKQLAEQEAALKAKISGGDSYQSALNSPSFLKMRQQAISKGNSPWAGLAIAKENLLASQGMDKAAEMAASQAAQAQSSLAATGGLTSGARERVIQQQPVNYMNMASDIGSKKQETLLDIGIEDAKMKQALLGKVGEAEMNDIRARQDFEQGKKDREMQIWAARQQANATRNSGKK